MAYIEGEELNLNKLKDLGFNPSTILDIGAHTGQFYGWAKKIWPQAFIWMVEANSCHESKLKNIDYFYLHFYVGARTLLHSIARANDLYTNIFIH